MVAIVIQEFGGRMPQRAARLLPPNQAQIAENCKVTYGDLRGHNDFRLVHEFPTDTFPKRVWRVQNAAGTDTAWASSTDSNATLLKSPLVNDAHDRFYLFRAGQPPQVTTFEDIESNTAPNDLAFGQPTEPPSLSQTGGSSTNLITRVYGYTLVTSWGEESRLSPVAAINVLEDATSVTVDIDLETPGPAPTIAGREFQWIRIYRTVTGTLGGQLYFVADIAYTESATSHVDTKTDLEIAFNSTLMSSQNDPPPDGIWGARAMGNGALVAFKDRDLYFSVPYLPHAWPEDWRLSVTSRIVGVEVMGQNVMVLTEGNPVLVYGSYPDAMGMLRFDFVESCFSHGSIVAAPEGIYFGSYNGLGLFTPTGVRNLTTELIHRNDWIKGYLDPVTRANRLTTRYIASRSDARGYIIDGLTPRVALIDLVGWLTVGDICGCDLTGSIFAISVDAVYVFDHPDEPEVDYRWKSKQFVLDKPTSLGALMLHLEERETEWEPSSIFNPGYEYPDTMDKTKEMLVKVWADGVLVFDRAVGNREMCRLPSNMESTVWEIEVQGQCRVQRIGLAETGRELSEL